MEWLLNDTVNGGASMNNPEDSFTRITKENAKEVARQIVRCIQEGYQIKVFDAIPKQRYDFLLWNFHTRDDQGRPLTKYFFLEYTDVKSLFGDSQIKIGAKLNELFDNQSMIHKLISDLFLSQFKIWDKEDQRELVTQ